MTPLLQPTSGPPVPSTGTVNPHHDAEHSSDAFQVVLNSAKSQHLSERDPEQDTLQDHQTAPSPDEDSIDESVLEPPAAPLPSLDAIKTKSTKLNPFVAQKTPVSQQVTAPQNVTDNASNEASLTSPERIEEHINRSVNTPKPLQALLPFQGSEGGDVTLPKNAPGEATANISAKAISANQTPPAGQLTEIPRPAGQIATVINQNAPSSISGSAAAISSPAGPPDEAKPLQVSPDLQANSAEVSIEITKSDQQSSSAKTALLNLSPPTTAQASASDTRSAGEVFKNSENAVFQGSTRPETKYAFLDTMKPVPPVAAPITLQSANEKSVITTLDTIDPLIRFDPIGPTGDKLSGPLPATPAMTPASADQARMIAQQLANGMPTTAPGTTEITLNPEELGRVRMSLSISDGAMQLTIHADRPETMDLMRRHIDQLAQTYRQLGFENTAFNFGESSQGGTDQQGQAAQGQDISTAIPTHETTVASGLPHASGRLDLRM